MKVELINYTRNAVDLLIYTKSTRLQGKVTMGEIQSWSQRKKQDELDYMRKTIKSSWEFVNYIFEITGVSRAFTHQLVRTRQASYAQQSQRSVDMSGASWLGISEEKYGPDTVDMFDGLMQLANTGYSDLLSEGVQRQDARGVLPTNTLTSIIMGCNLRTLHQMAEVRLCVRTQGEYQDVFRAMRTEVVNVHPWADKFIQVFCVNHGTCCFPNYKECPIQELTYNGRLPGTHTDNLSRIKDAHNDLRFESNPIAKDGNTM